MSSWSTTQPGRNYLKTSFVERASKRKVEPKADPGWWRVYGNSSLGDHYDIYDIHLKSDPDTQPQHADYYCTCQGNVGGEYRKVCSHKTGVVLARQEEPWPWGPWDDPVEGGEPELDFVEKQGISELEEESESERLDEAWGRMVEKARTPSDWEEVNDRGLEIQRRDQEEGERKYEEESGTARNENDSQLRAIWEIPDYIFDPTDPPAPSQLRVFSGEPPIPAQFKTYRPDQWDAICQVKEALDEGVKVVMVSAPTGAGKTLIAESVRRAMGTRGIYTCTTKVLQDQILRDFSDYAKVIKGRSNYPTHDRPDLTAADCDTTRQSLPACQSCPGYQAGQGKSWGGNSELLDEAPPRLHCPWCHPWSSCPYQVAMQEAAAARLAVVNTAYFLAETNFKGQRSLFRNWPVVLIDEADKLEEELMRFIEIQITAGLRKKLGVGVPAKKTVDEAWVEWLTQELLPAIDRKMSELRATQLSLLQDEQLEQKRFYKQLGQLKQSLGRVIEVDEEEGDGETTLRTGWVYSGLQGKNSDPNKATIVFKPVMVNEYAQDYLWNKGKQFVLLSATLVSAEQMAYDLGLEDHEWRLVEVPSSFPVERRPIVPQATEFVSGKDVADTYPTLIKQTLEILDEHPNERILVHSVSYALTKELYYGLRKTSHATRLHTYFNAGEREAALSRYLAQDNGVIIAPSFDRGVDLHGDDCRVIVVAKVPFPYLGDAQISARMYGTGRQGKIWYAVQAIRTLCQMTGRGMRSKDDSCITYILDKNFDRLYKQNRRLFPSWWSDAIVWSQNDPKWRDVLAGFKENGKG